MYGLAVLAIEMSILLQYLHIFSVRSKRGFMFWSVWTLIALNFLFYLALTIGEIFICNPREKFWNVLLTSGTCLDTYLGNTISVGVNVAFDFIMLLLPQRDIWKLQVSFKRRLQISLVFLTGLL